MYHIVAEDTVFERFEQRREQNAEVVEGLAREAEWLTRFLEAKQNSPRVPLDTLPGPEPPAEEAAMVEQLTPRELEVLRVIVAGNSTKMAAAQLGIAFKTAACHRHRIMQKLNIHETSSLVRFAIRNRLVDV